jgi:hypothetical protein
VNTEEKVLAGLFGLALGFSHIGTAGVAVLFIVVVLGVVFRLP